MILEADATPATGRESICLNFDGAILGPKPVSPSPEKVPLVAAPPCCREAMSKRLSGTAGRTIQAPETMCGLATAPRATRHDGLDSPDPREHFPDRGSIRSPRHSPPTATP